MSDHRNRKIFAMRLSTKEKQAQEKENVFITKQRNKSVEFLKVVPRKRSFSADLGCCRSCKCGINNDVVFNEIKSSARKAPFQIHFDRADNELGKGARYRERIVEYDKRRIETFRRNSQNYQPTVEKNEKAIFLPKLQQNPLQNFKESKAISRGLIASCKKPVIKSINVISKLDLPIVKISTAKSLIDLSKVNKPSVLNNRVSDNAKPNRAKLTPLNRNTAQKRSLSSSSLTKSNNLADGWNRVSVRLASSTNHLSAIPPRNRVRSTGSTNEVLNIVLKKQIKSEKNKQIGGSEDSLISGQLAVVSSNDDQLVEVVDQIQEITKASCSTTQKVTLTSTKQKSNDQTEQPVTDAISQKVQAKVESDLQVIQQHTDFSAYLLYHNDYLADLLTIEKEKDDTSYKLSADFIDKYINSESRKTVVAFLIHLTTHCRYPSFILYQAIKIFDATIDQISLEDYDMKLTALSALWIALKKDGNYHKIPSAKLMLEIAQDIPNENVDVLLKWERQILQTLNFNIIFSDPFSIFVFYVINYDYELHSSSVITKIYYCGGYIIDLTLLDAKFSYATTNHLGLTTAELVMSIILDDEANLSSPRWHYWRRVITTGVCVPIRYYDKEINLLRATMIVHILESAKKHTKEEVVRKRYSHSRYGNISEFFIKKIQKLPQAEYSEYL